MSDSTEIISTDTPAANSAASAPRLRLVDLLSQDVTPQVDSSAKKMIADGDALLVKSSRGAAHGFVLDGDHYDTRIEWTATEFNAICPCEQRSAGFVCPHIWSTVLLADKSGAFRTLEESRTHPLLTRSGDAENTRRSPNAWPAKPGWKIHLQGIGQAAAKRLSDNTPAAAGLPRQLIFVLDASATSLNRSVIALDLFARQHRKTRGGEGWSKAAPVRIEPRDIDTFTELADREILSRIFGARPDDPAVLGLEPPSLTLKQCTLRGAAGLALLKQMCETHRCRIRTFPGSDPEPLAWDDSHTYQFVVRIAPHDDGKHYTLSGHIALSTDPTNVVPLTVSQLIAEPVIGEPGILVMHHRITRIDLSGGLEWIELFNNRGAIHVLKSDAHEFLRQLSTLPAVPTLDVPEELAFTRSQGTPRPRLMIKKPGRSASARPEELLFADVFFDYDTGAIDALMPSAGTYDPSARKLTLRDKPAEAKALAILHAVGFRHETDPESREAHWDLPSRHLPRAVTTLLREGWLVEAEGKLYHAASDFQIAVASGIDWFDLTGSVQFGDQVVPLPRLLSAARKGEHLIRLADGTFGVLPEEWLAKYGVIVRSGTTVKDDDGTEAIRFSRAQAGMLDVLLDSQPHATADATFTNLRNQLRDFSGVQALEPPADFVGTLRPYQREGLGWFQFLREFSFGGCLADDMGLGKTIQVLALLVSRKEIVTQKPGPSPLTPDPSASSLKSIPRPSLVVAPRSLIFNWKEESAKFSPNLRILDHTGASRPRNAEHFADYDIILTTYGTLRSDILFLKDYKFDYAILDEAQAIKNAQTESAKAVRLVNANHRLALSGTPVQNHLGELWSLFEFLNPGMLGAATIFDSRYHPSTKRAKSPLTNGDRPTDIPPTAISPEATVASAAAAALVATTTPESPLDTEDEPDETPRQLLSRALRPFILRRTKEQVAQELPPCTEQTILCVLDDNQRALYEELREHYRQTLLGASASKTGGNKMQVLEALLRLRQAACHPGLIDKTRAGEPSAKMDMLLSQLEDILDEGHKALVFSQFTSLLSIVRKRLDDDKVRYAYLDGKTRDRKSPVEQFQNDPDTKLFLVSLKAGGLGLNLTGADYVFLLDPWWNPAVEAQAIDRAHRIGQTRHVFAYRLIAQDTVEEKVLMLQQTKRDLADAIISEDNSALTSLTSEDLAILLS